MLRSGVVEAREKDEKRRVHVYGCNIDGGSSWPRRLRLLGTDEETAQVNALAWLRDREGGETRPRGAGRCGMNEAVIRLAGYLFDHAFCAGGSALCQRPEKFRAREICFCPTGSTAPAQQAKQKRRRPRQ